MVRELLATIVRPAKTLPRLPWSAEGSTWQVPGVASGSALLFGLWLFGIGEAGLINARLGNTPWTVLAEGVATYTPLDIGGATIVISILVLLGWIPLRQRPGVGTVANVIVIGVALDVMSDVLPHPHALLARSVQAAVSIACIGVASALYLTAALGPGPRDGWMTGINRRYGWPIASVRASIELSVLIVGIVLGGKAGVATIAFALLVGYCLAASLKVLGALFAEPAPVPATESA
jgi:uncharacterized protein